MLVQIFEVQTPEEAAALVRLGVDHIGVLVGDGAFPRELSITRTNAIFAAVPAGHQRVALSLSADLEQVARVIGETKPDIVQVQAEVDDFPVDKTRALKARFPQTPIIRAIPVIDETSIETAASYRGIADFLLLDSYDLEKTAVRGARPGSRLEPQPPHCRRGWHPGHPRRRAWSGECRCSDRRCPPGCRRFEDPDRSAGREQQGPRESASFRRRGEAHQVNAVALSSTTPLF
jgi:phosphoribosylanthranilate isomerase